MTESLNPLLSNHDLNYKQGPIVSQQWLELEKRFNRIKKTNHKNDNNIINNNNNNYYMNF